MAEAAALKFAENNPQHDFSVVSDGYFDSDQEIEILERLTQCSIMRHLEKLFDVAYAPPSVPCWKPRSQTAVQSRGTNNNSNPLNVHFGRLTR